MRQAGFQYQWRKGLIGICALNMMSVKPVYGNRVAEELYELSDRQWKPGAGAIYPALHKLVKDRLAVSRKEGGRTLYSITGKGRSFLEGIRREAASGQRYGVDFGRVWLSIVGSENASDMLLRRLKMNLSAIESVLDGRQLTLPEGESEYLLNQSIGELRRVIGRLEARRKSVDVSGSGSSAVKDAQGTRV